MVLLHAFVYNMGLTTESVTKEKIPKNQAQQKVMYYFGSLKKESNKIFFPKCLIDRQSHVLSTFRLSTS